MLRSSCCLRQREEYMVGYLCREMLFFDGVRLIIIENQL